MDDRVVLVVEDDAGIRAVMVELFAEAGYTVREASGGVAGLRLAEECLPAAIVLNHVLPDMSGLDVLQRLRCRPATREIPVVLMSGLVQQLPPEGTGADCLLALPFDIEVLLAHVEQLTATAGGAIA